MAVRTIPTATLTQGYVNQGWYNGRKATTVRQRCNLVGGTYFALNYALPPRARVVWGEIVTQGAVTLGTATGGPSSNAADSYGLIVYPAATNATAPVTAPPNTATLSNSSLAGGTNGYLCFFNNDLTTANAGNSQFRGYPQVYATNATNNPSNTNTVPAFIALLPMRGTSGIHATSGGYIFGTATTATAAGTVDVTLYIEEYDQAPYA
jgi:hypothetical protein